MPDDDRLPDNRAGVPAPTSEERPREQLEPTVELGIELLGQMPAGEHDLPTVMDRLEAVATEPHHIRTILDRAVWRGVIDRDGGSVTVTTDAGRPLAERVEQRQGEFTCQRCGQDLEHGFFIEFDHGELGAFGRVCIEHVTGRRLE